MKVRELIEMLEDFHPEDEVMFAYNYGDYHRTTVAETVANVEEEGVRWSDYHKSHRVVDRDDDSADDSDMTVVVLSGGAPR